MNFVKFISYSIIELIDKYIHKKKIIFYLEEILNKPKLIIDVGAHKGSYTDLFLKFNNKSQMYLFEPNPYLYKNLHIKYIRKKNFKIFNYGIGEKQSKEKFLINKNSDYVSSFSKINQKSRYLLIRNLVFGSLVNKIEKKKVLIKKLDSLTFLKNKKIDLLKIDVEGYEEKVVNGGSKILRNTKVLLIEFHKDDMYTDFNHKRLHKKLLKLNFKLFKAIKFPLMSWEDRIYIR
jgi:FkbM family methyltransferase